MDEQHNELLLDRELWALVDRLLLEQGRLDPLELLLATELLAYQDYEAWRTGRRADIEEALRASPAEATELLERAGVYACRQKLEATPLRHGGWGAFDRPLQVGTHPGLVGACTLVFTPPAARHQMDLFHDSSVLVLEEKIRQALAERRIDRARDQVGRLMRQDPHHRHLRGLLRLIQVIDETDVGTPKERLGELEGLEPLARKLLGHRARDFLVPLWAELAPRLSGQPFDRAAPQLHACHVWARAGRWEAARDSVEREPRWREEPTLVLAHAEACWHLRVIAMARRDWLGLCWEHPQIAERTLGSTAFPDRRLAAHWNAFRDLDEELETDDFPAWLLLTEPGMARMVPADAAPFDDHCNAYRLIHRLVTGEDTIPLRRDLAEVHPTLLRFYLAGRE